jgi:lysophospholipase L1-like esterase
MRARYRRPLTDFQEKDMKVGRSAALVPMLALVGLVAGLAPALAGAAPAHTARAHVRARTQKHVHYYVALGDSLSQGVQPLPSGQSVETNQGYANDLYAYYRKQIHSLKLVQLGCPGDTTTSMLTGVGNQPAASLFHCDRAHGSQLAAAEAFLRSHRGEVSLVTLDIGANDVDGCVSAPASVLSCVGAGEASISRNTPQILRGIKRAAGKGAALAAMNLYDPVLAYALQPTSPLFSLAGASLVLAKGVNTDIANADTAAGFKTADVQDAFDTFDQTPATFGTTTAAENVVQVCTLTWACTAPPRGPNIHANAMGYSVIAGAFEAVLGKLP